MSLLGLSSRNSLFAYRRQEAARGHAEESGNKAQNRWHEHTLGTANNFKAECPGRVHDDGVAEPYCRESHVLLDVVPLPLLLLLFLHL